MHKLLIVVIAIILISGCGSNVKSNQASRVLQKPQITAEELVLLRVPAQVVVDGLAVKLRVVHMDGNAANKLGYLYFTPGMHQLQFSCRVKNSSNQLSQMVSFEAKAGFYYQAVVNPAPSPSQTCVLAIAEHTSVASLTAQKHEMPAIPLMQSNGPQAEIIEIELPGTTVEAVEEFITRLEGKAVKSGLDYSIYNKKIEQPENGGISEYKLQYLYVPRDSSTVVSMVGTAENGEYVPTSYLQAHLGNVLKEWRSANRKEGRISVRYRYAWEVDPNLRQARRKLQDRERTLPETRPQNASPSNITPEVIEEFGEIFRRKVSAFFSQYDTPSGSIRFYITLSAAGEVIGIDVLKNTLNHYDTQKLVLAASTIKLTKALAEEISFEYQVEFIR